ncbi:MAG TPA: nucleoside triphosphate pyrophosphohydrolase [Candidatus Desulfofervidus auxilii]|uniref:Nucleoside triphosphate pyrophosphohydrolase n=1 Tax=Desulfofervidus auxilii TaxID=1621989 RepID=A0A7V0IA19_DESA2|nr:nucleoside triphosphate pyrophosphohydrolase [Candidatus Desulfofervidus auxilii]
MAGLSKLEKIVASLRGENGCPWDKKQTPLTLKRYLLEEVYELIEAIDENDIEAIKEELGDVLFILVFLVHVYQEKSFLSLEEVIEKVANKMIRRHPHVFGQVKEKDIKSIRARWEEIKDKEKKKKSILDGIPKTLPALSLAYKIGERVSRVGFDWKDVGDVFKKIEEETEEFKKTLKKNNKKRIKEELGDVLFSWVNVARLLEIPPEEALRETIEKFKKRFYFIETELDKRGKSLEMASLKEMDDLWEKAKE